MEDEMEPTILEELSEARVFTKSTKSHTNHAKTFILAVFVLHFCCFDVKKQVFVMQYHRDTGNMTRCANMAAELMHSQVCKNITIIMFLIVYNTFL